MLRPINISLFVPLALVLGAMLCMTAGLQQFMGTADLGHGVGVVLVACLTMLAGLLMLGLAVYLLTYCAVPSGDELGEPSQ
jgi:hypothetical protein